MSDQDYQKARKMLWENKARNARRLELLEARNPARFPEILLDRMKMEQIPFIL